MLFAAMTPDRGQVFQHGYHTNSSERDSVAHERLLHRSVEALEAYSRFPSMPFFVPLDPSCTLISWASSGYLLGAYAVHSMREGTLFHSFEDLRNVMLPVMNQGPERNLG